MKISLPTGFAQNVINLEGKLDLKYTVQDVQELTQLYTRAIEYYEAIKDPKHLHYQERLHTLLSRADVLHFISNPFLNFSPNKIYEQRQKTIRAKQRAVSRVLRVSCGALFIERTAEEAIQSHYLDSQTSFKMLKNHLCDQSKSLATRLVERQKRHASTQFNMNSLDKFEETVEKVLEEFMEEKRRSKMTIKEKYRKLLLDNKTNHNVVSELEQLMPVEIERAEHVLQLKKNERIAVLRNLCI